MKPERRKVRDALLARGVPAARVFETIHAAVFPWHGRMLEYLRVLAGGDPATPEIALVREIAECASGREIQEALSNYHDHPARSRGLVARGLGLAARSQRVWRFYRRLRTEQGGGEEPG